MIRSIICTAALLLAGAVNATTVDVDQFGKGTLGVKQVENEQLTIWSGSDNLWVGNDLAGGDICALSTRAWNCANDLFVIFKAPVTDLSFDVTARDHGDYVKGFAFGQDGNLASKFVINRNGTFDLSQSGVISSVYFDDRSWRNGVAYGNFTFSEVAAVPLPATLPLMLAGLGAFGVARRRNAKKQ